MRDMIRVSIVGPSIFICIWLSILGSSTLYIDQTNSGNLLATLNQQGPEVVAYKLLEFFPFITVSKWLLFFTIFLSFVTAADSTTDVMSDMSCLKKNLKHPQSITYFKIFWGVLTGAIAWILITYASIDGIRILSNIGGFPIAFVCILFLHRLTKLLKNKNHPTP